MLPAQPPPSEPNPDAQLSDADPRTLVLTKGDRRYAFECPPGKEAEVMNHLALMIDADDNDLTWFDAALICDQLGKRMGQKLKAIRRSA